MAVNEIQSGRYNAVLHKLLSMKEGAPSPILAPEIIPVLPIESDRPEWAFLAGEALAWGFTNLAAVVGQVGYVELSNPAGSGTLCVVEEVICTSNLPGVIIVGIGTYAPQAGASASIMRDGRGFPGAPSVNLIGITTAVGLGGGNGIRVRILASTVARFTNPVVLPPGTLLAVQSTTANAEFTASVVWRERTLEPSETR